MAWRGHLLRAAALGAAAAIGVQAATVSALLLYDNRRRKTRLTTGFPSLPALSVVDGDKTELTVYTYGADLYEDMIAAIEAAEDRIYFETFIWKNDTVGKRFKNALIKAAERGVAVCCTYDVFANLVVSPRFFQFPSSVQVHPHPLLGGGLMFFNPRNSGRNHQKLLVVDGAVGFIGGYNIGSLYATSWRDTHVRCTGPFVNELENAFTDYWNTAPGRPHHRLPDPAERSWNPAIRVHRNNPRYFVYPIRNMYLEAIDRSSTNVWLTHAYLIPDVDLTRVLLEAARRGVDVRIIVPGESNHIVADWVSRGSYATLLAGGVRLFLYQGAMIHSKTATIDGVWSTVGTANLDRMSLAGNYEINLEITSPSFAAIMEDVFRTDMGNTVEVIEGAWARRRLLARVSERVLAPLGPLL